MAGPVIGGSTEEVQTRGVQRHGIAAYKRSFVESLYLGLEQHTAAFE